MAYAYMKINKINTNAATKLKCQTKTTGWQIKLISKTKNTMKSLN